MFILFAVIGAIQGEDPCGTNHDAFVMSQKFVKGRLSNPSSADFSFSDAKITKVTCGRWKVDSYVDAENAFGGTVRTPFTAVLERLDDGNWRLDSLKLR